MITVKEIRSALSGATTRPEKLVACKLIGRQIDKLIIEHTDESKEMVKDIIEDLKSQEITCLLGAQIHHILEAEPKYGKDNAEHYKKYRLHHYQNHKEGKVVLTVDDVFL